MLTRLKRFGRIASWYLSSLLVCVQDANSNSGTISTYNSTGQTYKNLFVSPPHHSNWKKVG